MSDASQEALRPAQLAFARYETALRQLGAVGEIGVGMDPELPDATRWWARCVTTRPLLVQGYSSGFDALAALCDLASRPNG